MTDLFFLVKKRKIIVLLCFLFVFSYLCAKFHKVTTKPNMRRITTILLLFATFLACNAQDLTVRSMTAAPFDLSAAAKPVNDYNGIACGLVKVRLASPGAVFGGNVMQPVEYKTGEYWVYMTAGSYLLEVKHPNFLPLNISFRDYGIRRVESNCTYILTLVMPSGVQTNVDDGMRYLIVRTQPANSSVYVDDKPQAVNNGVANVLVSYGTHTYRVEAIGYEPKSGTVEVADGKKTIDVQLESTMATLSVNCSTPGASVYVNEELKGTAPWSGNLPEGNYQIEARHEGYRSQRQSLSLAQRENRTVDFPALIAITGALNVNYQPNDAEVWIDGKKLGTSPDIFRNILVGNHSVEIRADGYQSDKKTISIRENETAQMSGSLAARSQSSSSAASSQSSSVEGGNGLITGYAVTSNGRMTIPQAVDLGLSVKWAAFNLGAKAPEEYGNYYKWGETTPADYGFWDTYKFVKSVNGEKTITKYCLSPNPHSGFGNTRIEFKGIVDHKTDLEPMDDAATVNLGDSWRMPTKEEMKELVNCKHEWTTVNGVNGMRVTGPNGNSIFLPASGSLYSFAGTVKVYGKGAEGCIWASHGSGLEAYLLGFSSGRWGSEIYRRAYARPIRPVLAK